MARITNTEAFQGKWLDYISAATPDELRQTLTHASDMKHSNENMAWLYDQLLIALASMGRNSDRPKNT
jgi:hypothetical protein